MAQGDLPTPRGSLRRRRREKRQLEQLAEASARHDAPRPATAHVRVVEDQAHGTLESQAEAAGPDSEGREPDSPLENSHDGRTGGFHVRAVPIDQPIGE